MAHSTRAVYGVSSSDVEKLTSDHPLGDIKSRNAYKFEGVADWRPDFAFAHLFHFALEQIGGVFSFQDFRTWAGDPDKRWMIWDPAHRVVSEEQQRTGADWYEVRDAMSWRVGLFYYSFLRELYTVARLREAGLDMRVHPLADALFRVDAWHGRVVFEMYVANKRYRSRGAGRKKSAQDILAPGRPDLRFVPLEMEKQRTYGRVHLPEEAQLQECAEQIRAFTAS
ncbi:hypothetical protein [Nocardiopsis sp. NPDC058789]|uniref:hypothetical protein n=1 Tax=Nocardiopsis sp. NPDC058789 TaxID=3346634 RepID=UPI0036726EC5